MNNKFHGKALYCPSGKAAEYSKWACNFYVGCSNGCTYCYCKKGILAGAMGQDRPQLKKCFSNENNAIDIFVHELYNNSVEIKKHGLFFSFTTDPVLPETKLLTFNAIGWCMGLDIPVKILTKCTDWIDDDFLDRVNGYFDKIAVGFTLTGHDELEPGAATNAERIEAMKLLHEKGFRTWASIEPIIDFESSSRVIYQTIGSCDLYKIGLMSGKKYDKKEAQWFWAKTNVNISCSSDAKVYWKDSFLKLIDVPRAINNERFMSTVDRDYNIFSC